MAVEGVNGGVDTTAFTSEAGGGSTSSLKGGADTGKVSPEGLALQQFLPSMVMNQLQSNSQLFNPVKEMLDEADGE